MHDSSVVNGLTLLLHAIGCGSIVQGCQRGQRTFRDVCTRADTLVGQVKVSLPWLSIDVQRAHVVKGGVTLSLSFKCFYRATRCGCSWFWHWGLLRVILQCIARNFGYIPPTHNDTLDPSGTLSQTVGLYKTAAAGRRSQVRSTTVALSCMPPFVMQRIERIHLQQLRPECGLWSNYWTS